MPNLGYQLDPSTLFPRLWRTPSSCVPAGPNPDLWQP